MSISITYNTASESNVTQEFSTASALKSFITQNKTNFIGAMKVVCDNSITDCSRMFSQCANIESIDLSELNTENVTNMRRMFYQCENIKTLNLQGLSTPKVTDMSAMFGQCKNLLSIDVSFFDTSKATDMSTMFYSCEALTELDVNNFNIENVTTMQQMFAFCTNLKKIYCEKDWNTSTLSDSNNMFINCTSLVGATAYKYPNTDATFANPITGYFSYMPKPPKIPILCNIDMNQNEIKNALWDKLESAPEQPAVGQVYYNTTDNKPYIYNGTSWDSLTNEGQTSIDYTNIENKPQINGVELVGNKTSADLGLVEAVAGKGLSTNDFTDAEKQDVANNTTARHTHANKELLDTYDQTNANISDAVTKKHTHDNKSILDNITASYTTEEQTKLGGIEAGAQVNTVASVNGKTGTVALTASDVGALPTTTPTVTMTITFEDDTTATYTLYGSVVS